MKKLAVVLLSLCFASSVFSQGNIVFQNGGPNLDARVTLPDGTPVGAGYIAQLYGGPAGTPVGSLQPLLPTTVFLTGMGYVQAVVVTVPGLQPGNSATFMMRVYDGSTWETSLCRGESNPVTTTLTRGLAPGGSLAGLQPFQVTCVPEPSTLALGGFTAFLLAGLYRGKRKSLARTSALTNGGG